jgi:hypothetical protein
MAETLQIGSARSKADIARTTELVGAVQIARDTEVRQSPNGVRFATFGETGLADLDLDRMLGAVPTAITAALNANTYYFVPLALREEAQLLDAPAKPSGPAMVASAYTDEFGDAAICHRNVELGHGKRGVFISTRLMGDRFALSFEFFINVAHAFVDQVGVPKMFDELVWKQAQDNVRGQPGCMGVAKPGVWARGGRAAGGCCNGFEARAWVCAVAVVQQWPGGDGCCE